MLSRKIALGFLTGLMLLPLAQAQVVIDIIDGQVRRTPVAVVTFGWQGQGAQAPLDVAQVISDDLYRSGRFDPY